MLMKILSKRGTKWAKGICLCMAASLLGFGMAEAASPVGIRDVEAVTEVYGDGENLSAVVLSYEKPVKAASVSLKDFTVPDRTIQRAYVSTVAEKGEQEAAAGPYVILELVPLPMVEQGMEAHSAEDRKEKEAKGFHGPVLGSSGYPHPLKTFSAWVRQKGKVKAVDGTVFGPSATLSSSHTRQLLIENFVQDTYVDPQQDGAKLQYNLFVPKQYDPQQSYPLVLFMHDAGAVSPEVKATLCQGRGAVVWTTPEWQAKHPCFVLAPQYDTVIVDDNYQYGPELDRTIHLVEELAGRYAIDHSRIYNTGQSMGGMTSIAMDVKYPDFFAASYLVACKWNAAVTAPLGRQNIWAVAAEGDPGAAPSMAEILGNLEKDGARVERQTLDAGQNQKTVNEAAASLIRPDSHIYYTLYKGGSHRYTWQHAYDMLPAMEWIFQQRKNK